jgi:hypothetical protein
MLTNPPVIDRRIRDLPETNRKLLALIGLSRQPCWKVGHLVAMLSALGHDDGITPVVELLKSGLLCPEQVDDPPGIEDFTNWMAGAGMLSARVFAHPSVASRARETDLGLPDLTTENRPISPSNSRRADGLDWPLRLAAVWQQVLAAPVRHTQANTLFKKDLLRLQTDEVLSGGWAGENGVPLDSGVLALLWARVVGLIAESAGELTAVPFPSDWEHDLPVLLTELLVALPLVEGWDPLLGYTLGDNELSPVPTAALLILLLLSRSGPDAWLESGRIADWLWSHHPTWAGKIPAEFQLYRGKAWVTNWLLSVAYPLQLVELSDEHVRLTSFGRWYIGTGVPIQAGPSYPQTLLVQPNAEILAYRQGLTPALIAMLSRIARWKHLGPACTLELTAEQTYRGLESGLTLPMILQFLARHSSRPIPPAVTDLLGRWSSKRERVTVFSSAVLVEFSTASELDAAVNRGIVALRLTDRIGMTADGSEPALTQLRLIANRDYESKPQRCVTVDEDGITLTVDPSAADLLLDAELGRFAVLLPGEPLAPRRFRLASELVRRAGSNQPVEDIDSWFLGRTGHPLSPAGRLFLLGPRSAPPVLDRVLIVRFSTEQLTDGVMQWPATRMLVSERLGPTVVAVLDDNLEALRGALAGVGIALP